MAFGLPLISRFGKSFWGSSWWPYGGGIATDETNARNNGNGEVSKGGRTDDQYYDPNEPGDTDGIDAETCHVNKVLQELLKRFPAPRPSYQLWDVMDRDPTICIARGTLLGEVLSVPRSYEARKDVPDKLIELAQQIFEPLMLGLLRDCFDALSKRWAPFEVEWGEREFPGLGTYNVPVFLKPLSPEVTTALLTPGGRLVGVRQHNPETGKDIDLIGPKAFVFVNEAPTGTPYGKSRHEDCRTRAWWPWMIAMWMGQIIDQKASGRVFHVKGPPNDKAGSKKIAELLSKGISTFSTNFLSTGRPTAQNTNTPINPDLVRTSAFHIEQFDLGNYAPANSAILDKMRYYDSLKTRSWRKPERSLLEGQHGTKAEAESHTESSRSDGEIVSMMIYQQLGAWTMDDVITRIGGEKYRNGIRIRAGSLVDRQKVWDEKIFDAALTDPSARPQVLNQVDVDAVFTRRGMPKLKNFISLKVEPPKDPVAPAGPGTGTGNPSTATKKAKSAKSKAKERTKKPPEKQKPSKKD